MNEKKDKKLGMYLGTAYHKLRKALLFDLVRRLKLDVCYRCSSPVNEIDNFSIDHKKAWLNSEDPVGLFFDLENIAFSHLSCNIKAKVTVKKSKEGEYWCSRCKSSLRLEKFYTLSRAIHGTCIECAKRDAREYKRKKKERGVQL